VGLDIRRGEKPPTQRRLGGAFERESLFPPAAVKHRKALLSRRSDLLSRFTEPVARDSPNTTQLVLPPNPGAVDCPGRVSNVPAGLSSVDGRPVFPPRPPATPVAGPAPAFYSSPPTGGRTGCPARSTTLSVSFRLRKFLGKCTACSRKARHLISIKPALFCAGCPRRVQASLHLP